MKEEAGAKVKRENNLQGDMGVERGVQTWVTNFEILAKPGCFPSFEWEKTNFTTFALPHWKNFGKILYWPH